MPVLTARYRPVGPRELDIITPAPRQPTFYPVTNGEYAVQIARDWNTRDAENGLAGHVSRFPCRRNTSRASPSIKVGGREQLERWMPAEELDEFNRPSVGRIEVTHESRPD